MEKQTQKIANDVGTLAEDARSLIAATADAAGEKVIEARRRLAAALENGKELYGRLRDTTVEKARAVDEKMHEHPYSALAVALGVGAIIGYLLGHRCSRND